MKKYACFISYVYSNLYLDFIINDFELFQFRIDNLVLADPWGYGTLPEITPLDPEYISPRTGQKTSLLFRLLAQILLSFNPLAMYRLFGRLSLYILSRLTL